MARKEGAEQGSAVEDSYVLVEEFKTQFLSPKAIAVDGNGDVYVGCSGFRGGLEKLTPSTSGEGFVAAWKFGEGIKSYAVRGLALAQMGNLLATVKGESQEEVQVFAPDGQLLSSWGSSGEGDGQFRAPTGIACDRSGNIYVAEATKIGLKGGNRVQQFGPSGAFRTKWGTTGDEDGELNLPTGIALDAQGNVHVADTYNSRVQKFAPDGTFLAKWGTHGTAEGQLSCPQALAFDVAGNIYVADTGNNRIQKLAPDGRLLGQWGQRGTGPGEFWLPCGIAVDGAGKVYVADTINNRVQVFRPRVKRA